MEASISIQIDRRGGSWSTTNPLFLFHGCPVAYPSISSSVATAFGSKGVAWFLVVNRENLPRRSVLVNYLDFFGS
jgi:hypothetical protein